MRRDLFSDGENGVFIDDVVLLETLVAKKLERLRRRSARKAGNGSKSFLPFTMPIGPNANAAHPKLLPLLPEQQTELDALTAELETLNLIEEPSGEEQARLDAINALDTGWLNRLTV